MNPRQKRIALIVGGLASLSAATVLAMNALNSINLHAPGLSTDPWNSER